MKHDQKMKLDIQNDIRDLAKIIGLLKAFLGLSVHVGRALNIEL
jgi:hypothetical protein